MARIISPWFTDLVHSWMDPYGDAHPSSTAGPVERWDSPLRAFRAHFLADKANPAGIRDPGTSDDFTNPAATAIPPLHGFINRLLYPGAPAGWRGNPAGNPDTINLVWTFLQRYHATDVKHWPTGSQYDADLEKPDVRVEDDLRRHFTWPRLTWYLEAWDEGGRSTTDAYNALEAWADSALYLRPQSHVRDAGSHNWQPPTVVGYNLNGTPSDPQYWHAHQLWRELLDWSPGVGDADLARDQRNYWDRDHLETTPQFSAAVAGIPSGVIGMWNLYRWIAQWPQDATYHMGNSPRSMGWYILFLTRCVMLGFGDATVSEMRTEQAGGVAPETLLDRAIQLCLGSRFPTSDPSAWGGRDLIEVHPDIHWDTSETGRQWSLCPGTTVIDPVTGKPHYIGSDGVDYGNQVAGKESGQLGILGFALRQAADWYDFTDSLALPTPFSAALRTDMDVLATYTADTLKTLGGLPSLPAHDGAFAHSFHVVQEKLAAEADFVSRFPDPTELGVPITSPAYPAFGNGIARELIEAGQLCGKPGAQDASVYVMDQVAYPWRGTAVRAPSAEATSLMGVWWVQEHGILDPTSQQLTDSNALLNGRAAPQPVRDRWHTLMDPLYATFEGQGAVQAQTTVRRTRSVSVSAQVVGGSPSAAATVRRSRGVQVVPPRFLMPPITIRRARGTLQVTAQVQGGNVQASATVRRSRGVQVSLTMALPSVTIHRSRQVAVTVASVNQPQGEPGDVGSADGAARMGGGLDWNMIHHHLPTGAMFAEEGSTNRERITASLSRSLNTIHLAGLDQLPQRDPRTATYLFPDWMDSLGLPDPCTTGLDAADAILRVIAHHRLTTQGSLDLQYLVDEAAIHGWVITIQPITEPLVKLGSRIGQRMVAEPSRHTFEVHAQASQIVPTRLGARLGQRLASGGNNEDMECLVLRRSPSYTRPVFVYT